MLTLSKGLKSVEHRLSNILDNKSCQHQRADELVHPPKKGEKDLGLAAVALLNPTLGLTPRPTRGSFGFGTESARTHRWRSRRMMCRHEPKARRRASHDMPFVKEPSLHRVVKHKFFKARIFSVTATRGDNETEQILLVADNLRENKCMSKPRTRLLRHKKVAS